MLHFFYPVLDALNDGSLLRKSVGIALRVLGVLCALGGLVVVVNILKYSFQPDTTTEATFGGIILSLVLAAGFACVVEIHFYRARSMGQLGESAYTVIQVLSVLCRLTGEVYATLLVATGVGGCVFVWLVRLNPLLVLGGLDGLLPAARPEPSFVGGTLLLIEMWLYALAAMVVSYAAAEGLLLAVQVARDVRRAPATRAPDVVPAAPVAAEFCKVCGVALVAGNTFCGNCGTRI